MASQNNRNNCNDKDNDTDGLYDIHEHPGSAVKVRKRGYFSGSNRLDPATLEEPDTDHEYSRQMWLVDVLEDEDFLEEQAESLEYYLDIFRQVENLGKWAPIRIHIAGKSHLDVAYKWRFEQTVQKAIKTLGKAVIHNQYFPESFRYIQSTPLVYSWVEKYDPQFFKKVKELVLKGVIEPIGGSWIEADGMSPSGEAWIRQRLWGMKYYKDTFGEECMPNIAYFPDSFGFNFGLPQLLKKSGADRFYTVKMNWNQTNFFPCIHHRWQSPDGSQVIAACTTHGRKVAAQWNDYKKHRFLLKSKDKREKEVFHYADGFESVISQYDPNRPMPIFGFFKGKGDGGHGPQHVEVAEMIGMTRASKKMQNEHQDIQFDFLWSSVNDYFNDIEQYKEDLPIWNDEMYLEDHRGTFSVHPEVKRNNRRLEYKLQATETYAVLLELMNQRKKEWGERLERAWKMCLQLQFHDVLPGSSVVEVFDDCIDIWDEIDCICDQILNPITENDAVVDQNKFKIQLYNPLGWKRKDRVFIPVPEEIYGEIMKQNDKPCYAVLNYQQNGDAIQLICQPVTEEYQKDSDYMHNRPAGWWTIISMDPYSVIDAQVVINPNFAAETTEGNHNLVISGKNGYHLANKYVSVDVNSKNGAIQSLIHKGLNNDQSIIYADDGHINNLPVGYLDDSRRYPAWNLHPNYWNHPKEYNQDNNVTIAIVDEGPIFVGLKIEKQLDGNPITQALRLFKDDPILYCLWASDWQTEHTTLKIGLHPKETTAFSADREHSDVEKAVDEQNKYVTISDQAYCAIQRHVFPTNAAEKARYEQVMHKYVDLNVNGKYGVAIINEGKYAYDTLNGRLYMTLHRTPNYVGTSNESWVLPERAEREKNEGNSVPEKVGLIPMSCRYAYYIHSIYPEYSVNTSNTSIPKVDPDLYRISYQFNSPIMTLSSKTAKSTEMGNQRIRIPQKLPENVVITALKKTEWEDREGYIFKLAEVSGKQIENIEIDFNPMLKSLKCNSIREVDFLERALGAEDQKAESIENTVVRCSFNTFEVKAFEIYHD